MRGEKRKLVEIGERNTWGSPTQMCAMRIKSIERSYYACVQRDKGKDLSF